MTESQRIADQLRDMTSKYKAPSHERGVLNGAIQALRQQEAEIERLKHNAESQLAAAVLKAKEQGRAELRAELLAGSGEPAAYKTDDIELYVREDKYGFYDIPLYTADQLAAAATLRERERCHALRQTLPNPYDHCQVSAHAYDMAIVDYGAAIRKGEQT